MYDYIKVNIKINYSKIENYFPHNEQSSAMVLVLGKKKE